MKNGVTSTSWFGLCGPLVEDSLFLHQKKRTFSQAEGFVCDLNLKKNIH